MVAIFLFNIPLSPSPSLPVSPSLSLSLSVSFSPSPISLHFFSIVCKSSEKFHFKFEVMEIIYYALFHPIDARIFCILLKKFFIEFWVAFRIFHVEYSCSEIFVVLILCLIVLVIWENVLESITENWYTLFPCSIFLFLLLSFFPYRR